MSIRQRYLNGREYHLLCLVYAGFPVGQRVQTMA